MSSKPAKGKRPKASSSKAQAQAQATARSNAAESTRLEAKADRIQNHLAEARKREAELKAQGYCF